MLLFQNASFSTLTTEKFYAKIREFKKGDENVIPEFSKRLAQENIWDPLNVKDCPSDKTKGAEHRSLGRKQHD